MTAPSFGKLDAQPFGPFRRLALFTTGLGVFSDGCERASVGVVLPLVLAAFDVAHVNSIRGAALVGQALVGASVGALPCGFRARRGRKKSCGIDVAVIAIAAIAQVFPPASGPWSLCASSLASVSAPTTCSRPPSWPSTPIGATAAARSAPA